jgi:hypothetical protein
VIRGRHYNPPAVLPVVMIGSLLCAPQAQPTPPGQLTVDASFNPAFDAPDFKTGAKPIVFIDEAHRNVISLATYLGPVGRWLERLGYLVRPSRTNAEELGIAQGTAARCSWSPTRRRRQARPRTPPPSPSRK